MTWRIGDDPAESDQGELDRRADEEARELRWQTFVEVTLIFMETEGVDGTLAAVARAIRERDDLDRTAGH